MVEMPVQGAYGCLAASGASRHCCGMTVVIVPNNTLSSEAGRGPSADEGVVLSAGSCQQCRTVALDSGAALLLGSG